MGRAFCWHMNCELKFRNNFMATKIKMLRLLEEVRGYAQITNRRPSPRPAVLYLMEIRSHKHPEIVIPKRRLAISMSVENGANTPLAIKITHVAQAQMPVPAGVC